MPNRKILPVALLSLGMCTAAAAADSADRTLPPADQAAYRTALEEMAESDQLYRTAISWGTTDPDELARLKALPDDEHLVEWSRRKREGVSLPPDVEAEYTRKQTEIDVENTARLMELVERFGWPTEERLGGGFSDPTAILIHMPMDRVGSSLPVLKREVLLGRMEPKKYAAIYDRKRQHEGKVQLYGLVRGFDPETGALRPPAITDIDETNRARAEIGLEPLTEYTTADE